MNNIFLGSSKNSRGAYRRNGLLSTNIAKNDLALNVFLRFCAKSCHVKIITDWACNLLSKSARKVQIFSLRKKHGEKGKQIQCSDAATISYTVVDRFTQKKISKTNLQNCLLLTCCSILDVFGILDRQKQSRFINKNFAC
jgi:hypothetical protein